MNHIYLVWLVVLKRPSFQSPKNGMPNYRPYFKTSLFRFILIYLAVFVV